MQRDSAQQTQPTNFCRTYPLRLTPHPPCHAAGHVPPNLGRLVLAILVVALACPRTQVASNDPIARVVQGNDVVAFRLYEHLAKTDGNLVFSPFGISMALAMTAAGANGNTLEEMRHTLAVQQSPRPV